MAVVSITERGSVWVIAMERAPSNAVDASLLADLERGLTKAAISDSCSALVVTGRDRFFSAGIDIKVVAAYEPEQKQAMLRAANRLVHLLYGFPKPTVAAVNGHALGAGLCVALACDLRIASQGRYELGLTEAKAGVPFPACPLEVVRAELAPEHARMLVLGADSVPATDPRASWFLDRVVPASELVRAAIAEAESRVAYPAYAAVKQQLRAAALERMASIVEQDADPLLDSWL
jgi:enoyl-CoA hydratase